MRKEKILSLHREYVPGRRDHFAVRFEGDPVGTVRRTEEIATLVPVEDIGELVPYDESYGHLVVEVPNGPAAFGAIMGAFRLDQPWFDQIYRVGAK